MPDKKGLISITALAAVLLACAPFSYAQDTDKFQMLKEKFKDFGLDQKTPELKPLDQQAETPAPERKARKEETPPEELPGMVYVPEGEFIMGTNKGFNYESPEHTVYLKGYYIDKYEVTNMQYKRFIDYTGYPAPGNWKGNNFPSGKGFFPVTNVSFKDAQAYAQWAGKRLPTEEEWEKAARYTDGRIYPWGNDWQKSFANVGAMMGMGSPKSIGSYPEGMSKYGVYDLCGNVWEWTASSFMPYKGNNEPNENYTEKNKVIRGGSYRQSEVIAQSVRRDPLDENKTRIDVGFRCAADR
jgi:gamma-glutamyl hercynylcysteine S-oxide synthase